MVDKSLRRRSIALTLMEGLIKIRKTGDTAFLDMWRL